MDDISRIRERVAKLLAMASDASSPEEAAIAARRARALLDKHQIDEASIRPLEQQAFGSAVVSKAYKFVPMWLDYLSVSVAKYNDCQCLRAWDTKKRGYIVLKFQGFEADVLMAKEMFERLHKSVDSWCKTYMTSIGHGSYYMASVGNAYKMGMRSRISAKLRELMVERDALEFYGQPGTSLVVKKTELVSEHFGEVNYISKKQRIKDAAEVNDAYVKGWVDGDCVNINEKVEG